MPAAVTPVRTSGGKRFKRMLRQAGRGGVLGLEVGFFSTGRYPDGTPVAAVAAWNEFGTRTASGEIHIPERPFFRQVMNDEAVRQGVVNILRAGMDPERGVVDPQLAGRVGAYLQGQVQQRIVDLDQPPNSPLTVAAKGSSNPLIASGFMRLSVTWRVS